MCFGCFSKETDRLVTKNLIIFDFSSFNWESETGVEIVGSSISVTFVSDC